MRSLDERGPHRKPSSRGPFYWWSPETNQPTNQRGPKFRPYHQKPSLWKRRTTRFTNHIKTRVTLPPSHWRNWASQDKVLSSSLSCVCVCVCLSLSLSLVLPPFFFFTLFAAAPAAISAHIVFCRNSAPTEVFFFSWEIITFLLWDLLLQHPWLLPLLPLPALLPRRHASCRSRSPAAAANDLSLDPSLVSRAP